MIINTAVIESSGVAFQGRLFGQTLLERNIRILYRTGCRRFILLLDEREKNYFDSILSAKLSGLGGAVFLFEKHLKLELHYKVKSAHFLMIPFLSDPVIFVKKGNALIPDEKHVFEISSIKLLKKAEKTACEIIRRQSGGAVAQAVNKRISIPVSRLLAKAGVHPNMITLLNFILGLFGVYLLSTESHLNNAAAGLIIQAVSVFDGCDGEVARMKTLFSKFGGMFDSFCDHTLAVLLIVVTSFRLHGTFSDSVFTGFVISVSVGVFFIIGWNLFYLVRYSSTYSFASFSREFLLPLSRTSYLARSIHILQYFVRKEVYSIFAMFFCFFNAIKWYLVLFGLFAAIGFFLVNAVCIRYLPGWKKADKI